MSKAFRAVLIGTALLIQTQVASASQDCLASETPSLQNGFGDLGVILGNDAVGLPTDCEHQNPDGAPGDTMQSTTSGVFYYYKFNNLVVFTDSGMRHWATAHDGILTWSGDKPFPPEVGTTLHKWDSLVVGQAP